MSNNTPPPSGEKTQSEPTPSNKPTQPVDQILTTIKDHLAAIITGISLATAWFSASVLALSKTSDIRIEKMNQSEIQKAESTRAAIESQLQEPISTLLIVNTETGNTQTVFVPTRFLTHWQPAKSGVQGVGDIISQDNMLWKKYTATLVINDNQWVSRGNYHISRSIGDHTSDAEDFEFMENGAHNPHIQTVASYSPSDDTNIQSHDKIRFNKPNNFKTINNTQSSTNQ